MSSNNNTAPIPAYRITQDDLPDMDKKTLRAIEPLLEALNRCLASVVAGLNNISLSTPKSASFTTDATGKAMFKLTLPFAPTEVWVSMLEPRSGAISADWSMAWVPVASGAQLTFFGLAVNTSYDFTVRYV